MKTVFAILTLGASIAQASSVDYIAIGSLLSSAKREITSITAGVACLMKDYGLNPSCAKIESINRDMAQAFS